MVCDSDPRELPVVVVHGFLSPKNFMRPIKWRLEQRGLDVYLVDLSVLCIQDVRDLAAQVAKRVEEVCRETGSEEVNLVGVSQGGLIGLWYLKKLGGAEQVCRFVSLGGPFQGTWFALVGVSLMGAFSKGAWQLVPGSDFLKELEPEVLPEGVDVISIALPGDPVCPPDRCRIEGAENVLLGETRFPLRHQWLAMSGRAANAVADALLADG